MLPCLLQNKCVLCCPAGGGGGGGEAKTRFFPVSNDGISSQLGRRRRRRPLSPLHARSRLRRCEHDFEHFDCSPAPMAIYAVSSVSSLTSPAAKSHTFATMFLLLSAFLYEETRLGSARRWVMRRIPQPVLHSVLPAARRLVI